MHHHFIPAHYHRSLGPFEPVLRMRSGDSVSTTTVDAAGCDQTGASVTPRGNPQTGPFFVEEAEPGDTLVVKIDSFRPNRPMGWARSVTAPNVVDPSYVKQLPEAPPAEWAIDHTAGTEHPAETCCGQTTGCVSQSRMEISAKTPASRIGARTAQMETG